MPSQKNPLQSQAGSLGWLQQLWAHFRVEQQNSTQKCRFPKKRAAPTPPTFGSPVDSCPSKASSPSFFITHTWLYPHFLHLRNTPLCTKGKTTWSVWTCFHLKSSSETKKKKIISSDTAIMFPIPKKHTILFQGQQLALTSGTSAASGTDC